MMQHAFTVFIFSFLLLWGGTAVAQQSIKSWEGIISARALNVRSGPSKNQRIVGKIKRGKRVQAFDAEGSWVHIREFDGSGKTGWVSRFFIRLPKDFMAPAFGDVENAFLEWASARGDLSVVSVESDNQLSLVLDSTGEKARAMVIGREVACAYRSRLSIKDRVVATVWPKAGPGNGWIVQVRCP